MTIRKDYFFAGVPVLASVLTSFVLASRFPTWGEMLIFWVIPSFFAAAVLTLCLTRLKRVPLSEACTYALRVVSVGAVLALILSIFRAWNDGSFFHVLSPSGAFLAFWTLGIAPFHEGPMLLVRLLPVVMTAGFVVALWRMKEAHRRLIFLGFCMYVGAFVMTHAMTWVALVLAWSRHTDLTNASDTFRLLTSAQADGYWLRLQAERFLFPVGQQAEYAIAAVHAALFMIVGTICAILALPNLVAIPSPRLSFFRVLWIGVAGYLVFSVTQFPQVSYTNIVALVLAIVVLPLFALVRFSFTKEEGRDRYVFLGVLLLGGALLGYPILMSLVVAVVASVMEREFYTEASMKNGVVRFGLLWASYLALIWAAALFVLRDVMLPGWFARFLLALAFLAAWAEIWPRIEVALPRTWCFGTIMLFSILVFVLARQTIAWILMIPLILACALAWRFPGRSSRITRFLPDVLLCILTLSPIIAPNLLRHV
jgi:hypothetical protein